MKRAMGNTKYYVHVCIKMKIYVIVESIKLTSTASLVDASFKELVLKGGSDEVSLFIRQNNPDFGA